MSRRGNPYDNALAENFFSILKTECIYRTKIASFEEARQLIDDYIYFYYRVDKGEKRDFKLVPFCLVALRKPKQGNTFHVIFKQVN